jgi:hypothetical protein
MATVSDDGTTRVWNSTTGALLAELLAFSDGGYAVLLPDGSYKLEGHPGASSPWWIIGLRRFALGELDPYLPEIRRLRLDAPLF